MLNLLKKHLVCRFKGHKVICMQEYVVSPDMRVTMDHVHACFRCLSKKTFESEEVQSGLSDIIASITDNMKLPNIDIPKPPYIH